jgi:hypothetical protein
MREKKMLERDRATEERERERERACEKRDGLRREREL